MKYINIIKSVAFRGVVLGTAFMAVMSCTGNYLEINTNPFEVSNDAMNRDGYAIGASLTALCGTIISPHINTAQFTEVLLGGPMGHYYASTGSWSDITIGEFGALDNWTNVFMASDRIIPVLYSNIRTLDELTDDKMVHSIATIVKVAAMHRVTDTYGAIPYSKIGVGGAISVEYDSQETVYDEMFRELDGAISTLTENITMGISPKVDRIYKGDITKWIKYANSLKLRLAMRIVYADPVKSRKYAEEAVGHEIGVLASNADNPAVPASIYAEGNSMFVAIKYNEPAGVNTGGDTHVAADICCYMNGYNDPRREKYFIPSLYPDMPYVGMRIGIVRPVFSEACKYSGVNLERKSDMVWMNAAEVSFLKAEAAAVFGFDMGGSAEDFYNEGIRLSFAQWGASGAEEYLADAESVPATYSDPLGQSYGTQLSKLAVKWDESATKAAKQERIIIQKWIANFNNGNEAWADYRRTGFPTFIPATDEGNKSVGKCVDNVLGPRRMPYPVDEYTTNTANINAAVSAHLPEGDNMGSRVWWDCNPAIWEK